MFCKSIVPEEQEWYIVSLNEMKLKLSEHHLPGDDPITAVSFLTRLIKEANFHEMSKVKAFIALQFSLEGFTKNKYEVEVEMVPLEE